MLTAQKILDERENGNLGITPWNIDNLNPNSYNVRLNNELLYYNIPVIDSKKDNPYTKITIPYEGLVLVPGRLYIGSTQEEVWSDKYISAIDGRSSIGRLGISIHATAGFGDIGFKGSYTLEIFCVQPVRIYRDMIIGQIYFEVPDGDINFLYNGRYQGQQGPTTSRYFMGSIPTINNDSDNNTQK